MKAKLQQKGAPLEKGGAPCFYNEARKCPPPQQVGARIPKQAASISPTSLKRQEEVLPMAKLEQRRYNAEAGPGRDCPSGALGGRR